MKAITKTPDSVMAMCRAMAEEANHRASVMQDMTEDEATDYARNLVENATVVYGIFPDAGHSEGFGLHIIKGKGVRIADIAARIRDEPGCIVALPCADRADAIAAAEAWVGPSTILH